MLPESLQIALDLLIQFAGDGGGHRPSIVPYGIGMMIWGGLLLVVSFKYRPTVHPHESLLILGFGFAFCRECFMLSVKVLEAFSLVSMHHLHIVFPPAEHALSDISTVIVIAAYIRYLTGNQVFSRKYMYYGIGSVIFMYLATFVWWGKHIMILPDSKFGQTWCDWVFRSNASIWFAIGGVYLWFNSSGWTKKPVCLAIFLFFLDDFLKLPDMALDEKYEAIFAPIRHSFTFAGSFILAYIFLRGHAKSLLESYGSLEKTIEKRTEELANANRYLFNLANYDGLTGLANRHCFEHDFDKLRANISRSNGNLSLMIVDIDFFKRVNDSRGHLAGDQCLKAVAKIMSDTFQREDDIVSRFGGEEFIVVVANQPRDGFRQRAETLRKTIEGTPIQFEGETINLTVSIGVAVLDGRSNESTKSLMSRADEMLYQVKESGRNQVLFSEEEPEYCL